ncbi:unnamed protein product [Prunus armeniaca]|uniref:Uncharacterized protein n=1 Tax=Prunus armeniaca TaxID=36596 RepID=A0A6J5X209_PRUAR|nr:unnamed protein product [Prunus armeniaca]
MPYCHSSTAAVAKDGSWLIEKPTLQNMNKQGEQDCFSFNITITEGVLCSSVYLNGVHIDDGCHVDG